MLTELVAEINGVVLVLDGPLTVKRADVGLLTFDIRLKLYYKVILSAATQKV